VPVNAPMPPPNPTAAMPAFHATSRHFPSSPEVPRCGGHRSSVRGEAQQRRGACRQFAVTARAVIALGLAAPQ